MQLLKFVVHVGLATCVYAHSPQTLQRHCSKQFCSGFDFNETLAEIVCSPIIKCSDSHILDSQYENLMQVQSGCFFKSMRAIIMFELLKIKLLIMEHTKCCLFTLSYEQAVNYIHVSSQLSRQVGRLIKNNASYVRWRVHNAYTSKHIQGCTRLRQDLVGVKKFSHYCRFILVFIIYSYSFLYCTKNKKVKY